MGAEPVIGPGLRADEGVLVAYPPDRDVDAAFVLGAGARLRAGTVLYAGSRIGDRFQTGHHVVVREESVIGDDVSVWSNSVVDYGCSLGDGVKVHANCYVAQYTRLAAGVFLAPGVTLANDLYPGRSESAAVMTGPTIGAGAQIGVNATILPFVAIGEHAIIGAGAVVTRDVPAGMLAYGNPAVVAGPVAELADLDERIEPAGEHGRYRLRRQAGR